MPQVKDNDELLDKIATVKSTVLSVLPNSPNTGLEPTAQLMDFTKRAAESYLDIRDPHYGRREPYLATDLELIEEDHPATQLIFHAMEKATTRNRFR